MLLISHRMPDVFQVCERVIVMRRGRKVADKPIAQTSPEEVTGLITGALHAAYRPMSEPSAFAELADERPPLLGAAPAARCSRRRSCGSPLAVLVIGLIVAQISPHFGTLSNLGNVLQNLCFIALLALGMTPVIITGGIDISVGSMMGLSGVVYGVLLQADWSFLAGGRSPRR